MATSLPTYDYEAEQVALAQQLRVAEAMRQQGLQPMGPTEMAGGMAVRRSPLEGVAKVLQAYDGRKQIEAVTDQQRALASRYGNDLKSGVNTLIDGLSATPGQATPEVQGNNPSAYQPAGTMDAAGAQKAKRDAVLGAIASNHPVLRDLGMSQLKAMTDKGVTVKDLIGHATGASARDMVLTGNVNAFQPKVELKAVPTGEVTVNDAGQITPPKPAATLPGQLPFGVGAPVPEGWKVEGVQNGIEYLRDKGGDLYQRTASGLKKMDNAPKITNTVNGGNVLNKGESKFAQILGEEGAKDLTKAKEEKVAGQRTIQSMQKLEMLDKPGSVMSGPGAPAGMWVASLADATGIPVDRNKLRNSETYQAEVLSALTSQLTGSLARSTTDKDMELLRTPLPELLKSAEGRAALRRQAVAKAQEKIDYADALHENVKKHFPELAPLMGITPGVVPVPQRSDASPGAVLTLDQYLAKNRRPQ